MLASTVGEGATKPAKALEQPASSIDMKGKTVFFNIKPYCRIKPPNGLALCPFGARLGRTKLENGTAVPAGGVPKFRKKPKKRAHEVPSRPPPFAPAYFAGVHAVLGSPRIAYLVLVQQSSACLQFNTSHLNNVIIPHLYQIVPHKY